MGKILSQDEIDALLSTVAQSEAESKRVAAGGAPAPSRAVNYDFKHPNRVSKDQLRKLENIHESFAGQLSSALSNIQRAMVDTDLVSVDQITYTEFISSLKSPSCTYTFRLDPLEGLCIIDFNPALAFAIVDRLFGGRGVALEAERELTGIERSVMRRIMSRVFEQLELGWERILKVKAEPVGFETNPHFIQIVPPGETVIIVSLQLNMPAAGGIISIGYPYVTLEPILDKLAAQNWLGRGPAVTQPYSRRDVQEVLKQIEVAVSARLGGAELSMGDVLSMEPGMVIPLDAKLGDQVTVQVEGLTKYAATVGQVGRRKAVRIEQSHTKET